MYFDEQQWMCPHILSGNVLLNGTKTIRAYWSKRWVVTYQPVLFRTDSTEKRLHWKELFLSTINLAQFLLPPCNVSVHTKVDTLGLFQIIRKQFLLWNLVLVTVFDTMRLTIWIPAVHACLGAAKHFNLQRRWVQAEKRHKITFYRSHFLWTRGESLAACPRLFPGRPQFLLDG